MAKRPRGTGSLYRQKDSQMWWMQFVLGGKRHPESTGTDDRMLAESRLQDRLAEARSAGHGTKGSEDAWSKSAALRAGGEGAGWPWRSNAQLMIDVSTITGRTFSSMPSIAPMML